MSFNNYGTVRAKTYLGNFANLTDLVVTGNATFSNLVYEREFINVSNTNVLNANIITVSDSLTLGADSILDASNAISIVLGSNTYADVIHVNANLYASNASMNVGEANLFTVRDLNASNIDVSNLTINSSLTLGPGVSLAVSTIDNSNLTNVQSLTWATGYAAINPTIAWKPAYDTYLNSNIFADSNLIQSNVQKFVTYGSLQGYLSYAHLAGSLTIPGSNKLSGLNGLGETMTQISVLNWGAGANIGNSYFQVGDILPNNIYMHKNFHNGNIIPPAYFSYIYEKGLTSHKFSNGFVLKTNVEATNQVMGVYKVDSSNVTSNVRLNGFSLSKGVGAMVVMCLLDKRYIRSLDDKIANYFSNVPTVGNNRLKVYEKDATRSRIASQDITCRHIFTETSGIIAASPLGDGASVPIRMTSDKKTYDLSDFTIASNVAIAIEANKANLFVPKDCAGAGALFGYLTPKSFLNDTAVLNTAGDWVQKWFNDTKTQDHFLTCEPGEAGTYSSTSQIATGLIEKIYEKATGQANTYHQILTEFILEPIGLTASDFSFWCDKSQRSNLYIDTFGQSRITGLTGSNFKVGNAPYSNEAADFLTSGPFIGPNRGLPAANFMESPTALYTDGSRNERALNQIKCAWTLSNIADNPLLFFGPAQADAPSGPYFLTANSYVNTAKEYANTFLFPDFRPAITAGGSLKLFDLGLGWSATPDTWAKIFSIISNNGLYIQNGQPPKRIISSAVIDGILSRDDGVNETKWPLIGQAPTIEVADTEGLYNFSTRRRQMKQVVTAYSRTCGAIDITGAEIPSALLNEYITRSNTAVTGLANIYSADSYNQLANLYNTTYTNIREINTTGAGAARAGDNIPAPIDIVVSGGASGIFVIMDRTFGDTRLVWGAEGGDPDYEIESYNTAVFADWLGGTNTPNLPVVTRDKAAGKIIDSPLLYSNWVNRNTLVAKPAQPLLRANRIELYPEGGVAANVVALSTDTLSNLVVSNVNSTILTCGPN